MPDAADPAQRLGVRLRPVPRSDRQQGFRSVRNDYDHELKITPPGPTGGTTMPRPRELRRSKLRNRDGDTDVNRCGGWSREKLERMDAKFSAAMERALRASEKKCTLRAWCGHEKRAAKPSAQGL